MLTREENELLTRVGPGTPMGNLIREFWIPALPSNEFPTPDSPAKRMKLLSENLVMFRDSDGNVGCFPESCPHRGASLYFGRSEEGGLRCIYHGWKFNVGGQCLEMPSEPETSNYKDKVRIRAYPCRDVNHMIWVYMGPRETPPPFPAFDVNLIPEENAFPPIIMMEEANWFQNLEGDTDSVHLDWLHARLRADVPPIGRGHIRGTYSSMKNPFVQAKPADYGAFYTARRKVGDTERYWHRINQFIFPIFTMVGGDGEQAHLRAHVPVDDTHSMLISLGGYLNKAMTKEERNSRMFQDPFYPSGGYVQRTSNPLTYFHTVANKDNDYWRDMEVEKTEMMSGVPFVMNLQDRAMTELMANPAGEAIYDRTREHLGTTDGMCIVVRRQLIRAANAHMEDGTVPPNVDDAELNHVRHACVGLDIDGDWVAASEAQRYSQEEHKCLCFAVLSMSDDADPNNMPAEVLGLA
ncbi:MAG: Rieske 2Fe-2S domain-containing protein [Chloroflexota bacterium]|nr:Rieske 2Fe-2S domain-containing protein [Chloroflexota bacterium]